MADKSLTPVRQGRKSTSEAMRERFGMRHGMKGCLAALTLAYCGVAAAHHSFAMFDQSKNLPLKGTVHDFQWTNPHAFIDVDVPNTTGGTDLWKVELNSPNNLKRQGWKSTLMAPGDKVTVVINPLRDGAKGGLFVAVTLADGKVMGDPTRAGGQCDGDEQSALRTIPQRIDDHGDFVAGRHQRGLPPLALQVVGAVEFHLPQIGSAGRIGDIHIDEGMRIGPLEVVHGTLQRQVLALIEHGKRVMCRGDPAVRQRQCCQAALHSVSHSEALPHCL